MRAPAGLCFVLAARHDVRLGLHRLRLDQELTEIRAADLKSGSLARSRKTRQTSSPDTGRRVGHVSAGARSGDLTGFTYPPLIAG